MRGKCRIDLHDVGHPGDACDRRDVAVEHKAELVVERVVDRVEAADHGDGVAVRRRADGGLGAEVAPGAGLVFDDDLLAEPFRQRRPDNARDDVGGAGRRERDDQMDRPGRIGLRADDARDSG
jgi:hypothetical protein